MKRKLVSTFLSVAMAASLLVGCGGGNTSAPATTDTAETATEEAAEAPAEEATEEAAEAPAEEATEEAAADTTAAGGGKVGVAMPTKDLQRWNQDGANMEAQLKDAGYEVDLQYASNDIATQVSQIENMISSGAQVLVIASIDGDSLGTVLAQAKEANIPVIAYDRLIMNSDAVSYYATFDNYMVGTKQGEYIRDQLDLDNADGPFNLEIFTGDPGDNNAKFFYNGAVDVLKPYIDEGKLVVKSGQVDFDNVATANWATETAQSRMDAIISANYADGTKLDAVLCSNDSTALGVTNSLEANYTGDWPIITGQDCDVANVKNMIAGKQSMSIFKDTRDLAAKTVEMVDAIMKGTEAPVNDTKTYDNGTGVIPSYLCEPVFADVNNYKELLIDSGYYTEDDLK
ncbi:multiple monosaccharide ABC transporter substrate-binding protein [Butyrivibrio sp. INlla16]|uniref:multiple monosaccharide ABC transporter substrate-binding protein n=1 Tax=Butyrivibrio sp. INlla16 TaxID=1520807 RepID=UPI00088913D8|nr:multiple monosaccharide ABC transporter substrate-binding protein [Butyrivibrio sp. INlla16]SDB19265.1 putative multiple sugar transport system substrate-binding protein [Butyrivibrio sp. INlla16]